MGTFNYKIIKMFHIYVLWVMLIRNQHYFNTNTVREY